MSNRSFRVGAMLVVWALSVAPVVAQDGLYAPSVPEDAALVRVVNLREEEESPRLDVGRERFAPLPAGEVGPYRPVPPGVYILGGVGGVEFSPEPGRFYSLVVSEGSAPAVVRDEAHTDPARAQLVMYNFGDAPADLFALPGDAIIFEKVPTGESEAMAVNAIEVALSVRVGGEELVRRELQLERGESYGIFVGLQQIEIAPATVSSE